MSQAITSELNLVQTWLREHEAELLSDLQELIRIPSVQSEPQPNAPFGIENRRALDYALKLGESWKMTTRDLDGYIGYAEFGTGAKTIAIFGHLDVVPVGPGWKHEPFGAEIDGEYLYSRGAIDDKGPTVAAFYAARAIKEICPEIGVRIRTVFGCNEESGFGCIHHYTKNEPPPTFGIAPDAEWPLVHAEKGIANLIVERPLIKGELELLRITGGQRPNIVIDRCEATLRVANSATAHVQSKLADSWDKNVSWKLADDILTVEASGKAAHAMWPFGGDSAAIRLFRFLMEIAPLSIEKQYRQLLELSHIGGVGLGIMGHDEVSEDLTSNLGIITTDNDTLGLHFNIRYPVTWRGETIRDRCKKRLDKLGNGLVLAGFNDSPPLYFPLDHPLVKTICESYTAETGETPSPEVMGGGTYARAVPNTVAVGTGWPGDGEPHQSDERIKVEHIFKMSRIYARILLTLARL